MQQFTDQSVDQRKDVPGQYLDIALVAGQYKIYCLDILYYIYKIYCLDILYI